MDAYTHFDWDPLCEAVLCIGFGRKAPPSLPVDSGVDSSSSGVAAAGALPCGMNGGAGNRTRESPHNSARLLRVAPDGVPDGTTAKQALPAWSAADVGATQQVDSLDDLPLWSPSDIAAYRAEMMGVVAS